MVNFTTPVEWPRQLPRIDQRQKLLLMGSCFASEMGQRLQQAHFDCDLNPYGVLYNPLSIATALNEILACRHYTTDDRFLHQGLWHSPMHHGEFSDADPIEVVHQINNRIELSYSRLPQTDRVIITLGTAYIYRFTESLKEGDAPSSKTSHSLVEGNVSVAGPGTASSGSDAEAQPHSFHVAQHYSCDLAQRWPGAVVGNCHKLPERYFQRQRITVYEAVEALTPPLQRLFALNPSLQVLITVSPIRHLRDGLHANQLSKSTLLLAAESLCHRFANRLHYLPIYEVMTDELRDYRFYADDLTHPAPIALEYIWQQVEKHLFTPEAVEASALCKALQKQLSHRPLHPETEAYKRFLEQTMLKISQICAKFPYLDLKNEQEQCRTLLNRL